MPNSLDSTKIKEQAISLGFHKVGIANAQLDYQDNATINLERWLSLGYHGDLAWMNNSKRKDILEYMPEVRSIIALVLNYYTPQQHSKDPNCAKISRYGWGGDYHKIMRKKLKQFSRWLEAQGEDIVTRFCVDTSPVQDKVWAERAGLGWIAKNTNIITRDYGSWVFLGEILINIPLTPDTPSNKHCGTCTRCLDACPTGALIEPFVLDAQKCIAYHTIENRAEELPQEIAIHLEGWIAGCDICQDVCPWNERFAKETDIADFQPSPENISPKLTEIATISEQEYSERFKNSPLKRIKPTMLRRNARANLRLEEN